MADGPERANMAVFTDTEDSTYAGTFVDPAATPTRMVHNDLVKWNDLYNQNQRPSQIERMQPRHLGASMEDGSSTIDSRFQERMKEHQSIEQLWQILHISSLQARQYSHKGNPWQVHDHGWAQQQPVIAVASRYSVASTDGADRDPATDTAAKSTDAADGASVGADSYT